MLKAEVFQNAAFRHAQFYLEQLQTASQHLTGGEQMNGFALFDAHWAQIRSAFERLTRHESKDNALVCNQYVNLGINFLRSRRPVREQIDWLHAGIDAARHLGSVENEILYLIRLGDAYLATKSLDDSQACFERALTMARAAGMREAQGWALKGLGTVRRLNPSEIEAAREHLYEAIDLFRALNHLDGLSQSLHFLGTLEENAGNLDDAQKYVEAALAFYQELSDARLIASALIRLASLAERTGEYERGIALLEQAIRFAQDINDETTIARALLTLGLILDLQGDKTTAKTYFEQALTLSVKVGSKPFIGTALLNLCWVAAGLNEYDDAVLYSEQAVALYRELRYPARIAAALCNLGYFQIQLNRLDDAEQSLFDALNTGIEVYAEGDIADVLLGYGWLRLRRGDPEWCAQMVGMTLANPPAAPYPERQSFLDMVLPEVQAALSPQAYQAALDVGAGLDLGIVLDDMLRRQPSV